MDPATHLRTAAAILRRDGWTQFAFVDATGARCALGAMGLMDHDIFSHLCEVPTSLRALATALGCAVLHEPDRHYAARITAWNDDPEQSQENVILALEFAALLCEEQRRVWAQTADGKTEAA